MGMGFRLISQYESMNEEHRSAGTEGKQDLTGVKKREIRVEKKIDDWGCVRGGDSGNSCKISVTKSWSRLGPPASISFIRFDRKILVLLDLWRERAGGEGEIIFWIYRCLDRLLTITKKREGRSTLEDGRNLVDGGATPVLFGIINFSMEVLSKGMVAWTELGDALGVMIMRTVNYEGSVSS